MELTWGGDGYTRGIPSTPPSTHANSMNIPVETLVDVK